MPPSDHTLAAYGSHVVTSAAGVHLAFDERGYLSKGRHEVTVPDVEQLCVLGLPDGGDRRRLFESWLGHRQALVNVGVPLRSQWLNGSFVTARVNPPPGDVDVVSIIDAVAFDALPSSARATASLLLGGHGTRDYNGVDSFLLPHYELSHPERARAKKAADYWDNLWGRGRKQADGSKPRKGYLEVRS